jgi:hypothetical protein
MCLGSCNLERPLSEQWKIISRCGTKYQARRITTDESPIQEHLHFTSKREIDAQQQLSKLYLILNICDPNQNHKAIALTDLLCSVQA